MTPGHAYVELLDLVNIAVIRSQNLQSGVLCSSKYSKTDKGPFS